jgi:hypothetical protein
MALPAQAAAPALQAVATLEKGRWQVRELHGETAPAAMCLSNAELLLRFEHRAAPSCSWEVVENAAAAATVQYSCAGRGFGYSHLRVETPRSVRIDTQGFSNGRPFSYRLEARRTGAC